MGRKWKIGLITGALFLIPFLGALKNIHTEKPDTSQTSSAESTIWRLQLHQTGETIEIPVKEYIKGVVAAEMPIDFEEEALKAQAVAAHTYALHIYQKNGILSDDPNICQAYYSQEQLKEKYKENFEQNWEKLTRVVDAVADEILLYQQEPIVAVYHSMSAGKTESSKEVWGDDLPYLQPVDSSFDTKNANYNTEVALDLDTCRAKLQEAYPGVSLSANPHDWIRIIHYDPSGYVGTVQVGDLLTTGVSLRRALGLKSAHFSFSVQKDHILFTTQGSGHGIGMSQYGANAMAGMGFDYRAILHHYYPTASLGLDR